MAARGNSILVALPQGSLAIAQHYLSDVLQSESRSALQQSVWALAGCLKASFGENICFQVE